jgi:hypothetical protein
VSLKLRRVVMRRLLRIGSVTAIAAVVLAVVTAGVGAAPPPPHKPPPPSPPVLAWSPSSGDFGAVAPGATSEMQFTLSVSRGPLGPVKVKVSGSTAFSVTGNTCGPKAPKGGPCVVTVDYAPAEAGQSDSGTLTATAGRLTASLALSGTAGGAPGCLHTATTGCLDFDNTVLQGGANIPDYTLTLNGAFTFATTCNDQDPSNPCPDVPNSLANGGGSFVINDGSGNIVDQGTLTMANTAGTFEGLDEAFYQDAGSNPTSCSAAVGRYVQLIASTDSATQPVLQFAGTFGSGVNGATVFTGYGVFSAQAPAGEKFSC